MTDKARKKSSLTNTETQNHYNKVKETENKQQVTVAWGPLPWM